MEGTIIYNITTQTPDGSGKIIKDTGVYTYIIKGRQLRKEIKMDNGYQDVLLFNCNNNTVYSLKTLGDKKYAIQLNMEKMLDKQQPYQGFELQDLPGNGAKIAGYDCRNARITYKTATAANMAYTSEWYPAEAITFEHFPAVKVWPLAFSYTLGNGAIIQLRASKMEASPVENALFHIPHGYKLITYKEYEQMKE